MIEQQGAAGEGTQHDELAQETGDETPIADPPTAAPNLSNVIARTNEKACSIETRNSYVVTGYVLTHRALAKKAVVDMNAVRWFPNVDEFMQMMTGQKFTPGPGTPPPGWSADELFSPPAPVAAAAPALPVAAPRPVLTAPPTAQLVESAEEALGMVARELGCVFNDTVPHNAGWFVPGKHTAYASALDAIMERAARLKASSTLYQPPVVVEGNLVVSGELVASEALPGSMGQRGATGKQKAAPPVDDRQCGLF